MNVNSSFNVRNLGASRDDIDTWMVKAFPSSVDPVMEGAAALPAGGVQP
jgi:hypothetical protein